MHEPNATSSGCLTDRDLDAWSAGELSPTEVQRCEAHSAVCNVCRARKLALEPAHQADIAPTSPVAEAPVAAARSRWLVPLLAACASLAWLSLRPSPRPVPAGATPNTDAPRLGYLVKRGSDFTRADASTPVFAGDALRFVYSVDRAYYLAIYSADARGVSVYFPSSQLAHQLSVGRDVQLDFNVELDETVGRERLIGLFCPEAFAVERVQGALTTAAPLPEALAGCQRVELELNKKARP